MRTPEEGLPDQAGDIERISFAGTDDTEAPTAKPVKAEGCA